MIENRIADRLRALRYTSLLELSQLGRENSTTGIQSLLRHRRALRDGVIDQVKVRREQVLRAHHSLTKMGIGEGIEDHQRSLKKEDALGSVLLLGIIPGME